VSPRSYNFYLTNLGWDKFLTVNSGFLDKLLSGDVVLADQGFDIEEDVARMQATSFTRGCIQLTLRKQ